MKHINLKNYCVFLVVFILILIQTKLKIHVIINKIWQCPDALQESPPELF